MDMETSIEQMEVVLMDSFMKTIYMGKGIIHEAMGGSTLDNEQTTKCTGTESSFEQTEDFIKGNMWKIKSKDMECFIGQMEEST